MHSPWRATLLVVGLVGLGASAAQPALQWEPLRSGATARLRGLHAVSPDVVWASGERGTVVLTRDGGRTWQLRPVAGAEALDFRDIHALDARSAVAMSAGPGQASRIYTTDDGGAWWTLRFTAPDPGMFLDAMAFADARHGWAFSDSVGGQFVLFATADGGLTWTRVPSDRLPGAREGEGAFAASGTNVAVLGSHVWLATTASRVLHSADGGQTWALAPTPVPAGEATGIFSIAFRDTRHGVVVGGVYTKEREATANVAVTSDGAATWVGPRGQGLSGYRSAVAHVPAIGAAAWLAVGPSGSDLSLDDGASWAPAGGEGYDAISVAPGRAVAFAAGSGGRIGRVRLGQ